MSHYGRDEVIFRESALANEAHVLIAGIARITCLNADNQRVTVALIAPGPIPSLLVSGFDFRCEAYNEYRVGTLDWKGFNRITLNGCETVLKQFHQNDLKYAFVVLLALSLGAERHAGLSTPGIAIRYDCRICWKPYTAT